MIDKDFQEFLLALNAHGVEYLIVGAYAVAVHAEPRATKDLDIFIRADEKNSNAVYSALAAFGAPVAGFAPNDFKDDPNAVYQIGVAPARIDILQSIDGVAFEEAWQSKIESFIDETIPVYVISREHLIQNKLASGREQDIADVKALRSVAQIHSEKNK